VWILALRLLLTEAAHGSFVAGRWRDRYAWEFRHRSWSSSNVQKIGGVTGGFRSLGEIRRNAGRTWLASCWHAVEGVRVILSTLPLRDDLSGVHVTLYGLRGVCLFLAYCD